jgi:glyoxalase/bleomycin resistance protein/dioxygenase superfamily protein
MALLFERAPQWGFVVKDIEASMQHWIRTFQVAPFIHIATNKGKRTFKYYHQDTAVELSVAWTYFGETQIELIQQLNDAPSPYRDFLAQGREGFHHLCFWSERYDEAFGKLEAAGYVPVYRIGMGLPRETVYFKDYGSMGAMVELSLLTPQKKAFYAAMARFVSDWGGGADSVKRVASLDAFAEEVGAPSMTATR